MNKTVRKLFYQYLLKMMAIMMFLPGIMVLGYLIAHALASSIIWMPGNPIYIIGKAIERNIEFLIFFGVLLWFPGTVIYFFRKPFVYLSKVLNATENLYKSEELIKFPTDLKEAENQLNHVKMSMMRNERAAKEAEQRKNDLIVYLAHDLKTPLTSVIGYLTLLRDENQISDELRERYLSISLEKAEHLEDLINEFFEITRFNLSNLSLELSNVNLTRMLEQISYEFMPMLDEKGLTCRLDMPKDLMVKCDVGKMQRVFDNLLRNAVNYSFENEEILLSVAEVKNGIQIVCENKGNTIPEEKLNRIFEQFFRLDTARTTRSGGAGLGLAIAKEIVELHKGTITAKSADDTVRFEIFLPRL